MKVRVGVQMLVKTYLPRSLTCQVTPAPVNFSCHVTALSLERITSLVMCLILTQTSDLCPRWMDGAGSRGSMPALRAGLGFQVRFLEIILDLDPDLMLQTH